MASYCQGSRRKLRPAGKPLCLLSGSVVNRPVWHWEHPSSFSLNHCGPISILCLHSWHNVAVWGHFLYSIVHWIPGTPCADENQNQPAEHDSVQYLPCLGAFIWVSWPCSLSGALSPQSWSSSMKCWDVSLPVVCPPSKNFWSLNSPEPSPSLLSSKWSLWGMCGAVCVWYCFLFLTKDAGSWSLSFPVLPVSRASGAQGKLLAPCHLEFLKHCPICVFLLWRFNESGICLYIWHMLVVHGTEQVLSAVLDVQAAFTLSSLLSGAVFSGIASSLSIRVELYVLILWRAMLVV